MATSDVRQLTETWPSGEPPSGEPPRRTRTRQRPRRRRGFFAGLVGVVGELMITLGVLLGLFVVWQLWWTDVEANAFQDTVLEEWQATENYVEAPSLVGEERRDAPPVPAAGDEGDVMGVMHIPRLGEDYKRSIASGVGLDATLNRGYIGHYPETARPGEIGNFASAAHRQSYGAPYKEIEKVVDGDSLIVETDDAYIVYRVTSHEIVYPDQVEVIAPVPNEVGVEPTERLITLTTCHPLFSAAQRWITYGEFDYWVDKADGMPAEMVEGGN
ncbi:class E sortase [Georgenia sp. MJ170]|uniref:class E sortase n=1 Tax=Georgenia sunbinii TaxID=3117728 RepID=UPI002F26BE64